MFTTSIVLKTPRDFGFWPTVWSTYWCALHPFHFNENERTLTRIQKLTSGKIVKAVMQQKRRGEVLVNVECHKKLDRKDLEELKDVLATCLRLDEDMSPLYDLLEDYPEFSWVRRDLPVVVKVFASNAATSTVLYTLSLFESRPQQREVSYQAGTTTVWEQWTYPSWYSEVESNPFVSLATGSFDLTWQFDRNSARAFRIKITGYVNWAEFVYIPGRYGADHWKLNPIKWEAQYLYLTVNA